MNIFPSLTDQNLDVLKQQISLLEHAVAGFHIDLADEKFVHSKCNSIEYINEIRTLTQKRLWIHLMVEDPHNTVKQLQLSPQDIVTFHSEAVQNYEPLLTYLSEHGLVSSIALNPETPLTTIAPLITTIAHITIMSTHPGKSRQKILSETWQTLKQLQEFRATQVHYPLIAVDGDITTQSITRLAQLGVNDIAVHNTIFTTPDPLTAVHTLYTALEYNL